MDLMPKMKKLFISVAALMGSTAVFARSMFNMPTGVTPVSHSIYYLHMTIFWICVAIGVAVFSVMIYSIIVFRKSKGAVPSSIHDHPTLEVVWAIVPFIILVAMAIPATKVLMKMDDTSKSDLTIKITGYQWKWKYDYLDEGISFFSNLSTPQDQIHNKAPKGQWYLLEVDHPLVVPVNKKIRFVVTSNDVIHSWWVPDLGIKRDAIPGFIHEAWAKIERPGTYRGQCAELCGMHHAYMPIVVKAVPEDEYTKWVQLQIAKSQEDVNKVWKLKELMSLGEEKYNTICAACHKVSGLGQPPVFPALKGSKITTGKPISKHIKTVLRGVKGTAMQAFGTQLNNTDIAAIITYERNAFGNNTGDVVQPLDVKKLR